MSGHLSGADWQEIWWCAHHCTVMGREVFPVRISSQTLDEKKDCIEWRSCHNQRELYYSKSQPRSVIHGYCFTTIFASCSFTHYESYGYWRSLALGELCLLGHKIITNTLWVSCICEEGGLVPRFRDLHNPWHKWHVRDKSPGWQENPPLLVAGEIQY